ncbi:unnamed protein product [Brachionus calyciflorus]|uniref:ISXO2-like transposase domain-containing protein n=1 Tax=Brachionus calyciflorus TaxID=104777 RepID=A0A814L347_9BILA|nr:unnamed protein product [Brachionus calyciflorus]
MNFTAPLCTLAKGKKNIKLVANGKIVEIDESLFAIDKHSKCKDLKRPRVWTFGLVERRDETTNDKVYLEVVPNREAQTLLAIIYEKRTKSPLLK